MKDHAVGLDPAVIGVLHANRARAIADTDLCPDPVLLAIFIPAVSPDSKVSSAPW